MWFRYVVGQMEVVLSGLIAHQHRGCPTKGAAARRSVFTIFGGIGTSPCRPVRLRRSQKWRVTTAPPRLSPTLLFMLCFRYYSVLISLIRNAARS